MARKTFFSFHYERDAWRAGQVRNCDLIPSEDEYGFVDAVDWESIKKQGDEAVKRWIKEQLKNTSVTVVLVGAETARRPWVQYEILESWNRGNGLLGIWIHGIKDQDRQTDAKGLNPFVQFKFPDGALLSSACKIYDWIAEDGRNGLGTWIEKTFQARRQHGLDQKITTINGGDGLYPVATVIRSAPAGAFHPQSPWCHIDVDRSR